jgi:hypothetical protein
MLQPQLPATAANLRHRSKHAEEITLLGAVGQRCPLLPGVKHCSVCSEYTDKDCQPRSRKQPLFNFELWQVLCFTFPHLIAWSLSSSEGSADVAIQRHVTHKVQDTIGHAASGPPQLVTAVAGGGCTHLA